MPLSDGFAKHGIKHVVYDPIAVIEAFRSVFVIMKSRGQSPVSMLGVAALIVWCQAEVAKDTIDNTIELMRIYLHSLQRDERIKRATS